MQVKAKLRGGKWRVVHNDDTLARERTGVPVDGGGHDKEGEAKAQARAINANLKQR